ncbi:hypothetical protein M427DRAFT_60563, partial [Gonapodya prolifera JEL478]
SSSRTSVLFTVAGCSQVSTTRPTPQGPAYAHKIGEILVRTPRRRRKWTELSFIFLPEARQSSSSLGMPTADLSRTKQAMVQDVARRTRSTRTVAR